MDRAKRDILKDIDYYEEMDDRRGYRKRPGRNNLLSNGLQNKEIAGKLGIKTRTVEFHVGNILLKLGVNSRLEAVIAWKQIGA